MINKNIHHLIKNNIIKINHKNIFNLLLLSKIIILTQSNIINLNSLKKININKMIIMITNFNKTKKWINFKKVKIIKI